MSKTEVKFSCLIYKHGTGGSARFKVVFENVPRLPWFRTKLKPEVTEALKKLTDIALPGCRAKPIKYRVFELKCSNYSRQKWSELDEEGIREKLAAAFQEMCIHNK